MELIRQAIKFNPDCRILLASQTHVALDNALERLLCADKDLPCVRIGSGSRTPDSRVAASSLDHRSAALQTHVAQSAREFIGERAVQLGIDRQEVKLGLSCLDVIGAETELERVQAESNKIAADIEMNTRNVSDPFASTTDRSGLVARTRVLEDESDRLRGELVLATAAVKTSRRKLIELGTDGVSLAKQTIEELREWSSLLLGDESRKALGKLMQLSEDWRLRFAQSDDFKAAIISSSSVVAGTCVGFCREDAALRMTFDICIIDEAGKATTTELLVPLAQSRRAVLLGDHHQLPAVLDYEIKSRELMDRFGLNEQQLDEQIFEKLIRDLAEGCKASLTVQYRMRGAIGRLISECFYEGRLDEGDCVADRALPDLSYAGLNDAVTWLDPYPRSGPEFTERKRITSFENAREVHAIVALLKRLTFVFTKDSTGKRWPSVGIISGYASQTNLLRNTIRKEPSLDKLNIECASVHSFQGREVDVCIYSVTRKNREHRVGMLKDWRHLNVALSRARNFLVIVGSMDFCRDIESPNPFRRVITFIEDSNECSIKAWDDD